MHSNLTSMRLMSLFVLLCACGSGCFNTNNGPNCVPSGNCTTLPPTTAQLILKITVNTENPAVPVAVYLGDASDSLLYFADTLGQEQTNYDVPLDTKYSAVAKYRRGALTILAVDGGRTKLKSQDDCGDTCYSVDDATMNLRLTE